MVVLSTTWIFLIDSLMLKSPGEDRSELCAADVLDMGFLIGTLVGRHGGSWQMLKCDNLRLVLKWEQNLGCPRF